MTTTPQAFQTDSLAENDDHRVFFSRYGNPKGPAIVVLHGGPGSRSKPKQASGYNLDKYQVITFDQRGCGQSQPTAQLAANTTQDLIADMERLRAHLQLETWFVAGGSWGSTLALAYAEAHPNRVRGLLLSAVFLARPEDIAWSFTGNDGVVKLFPDSFERRTTFLNTHATNPAEAARTLLQALETADLDTAKQIVAGIGSWENNLMTAQEDIHFVSPDEVEESDINDAKIWLHYESNHFFLKPNQLVTDLNKIKHIPTVIVHGRYDVLCPVDNAWTLQKQLEHVDTIILPSSNHKFTAEGEIARKLAFGWFLDRETRSS